MSINENTKPRALLLLRVSTAKQVNGNDDCPLPIQQEKCVALCEQNGWNIIDIINESKSGYKNAIYEREAIEQVERHVIEKDFDILVVFKYDRIGRTGVETAYFIMNLLNEGIRVYSATEGEITNDTFESEFMLVMKGLLAKQESRNTSIRVKAAMDVLIENGGYRGGAPMFGYQLISTGKTNRKGRMINNLCVEEREAEHVREIFRMTAEEGKGTHQLAEYLNNKGIKTHNGAKFQRTNVMRLENLSVEKESAKNGYSKLTTWAEEYSMASIERKKMIIAEIFDRIEIKKGYEIIVTLNEIYKTYITE